MHPKTNETIKKDKKIQLKEIHLSFTLLNPASRRLPCFWTSWQTVNSVASLLTVPVVSVGTPLIVSCIPGDNAMGTFSIGLCAKTNLAPCFKLPDSLILSLRAF